MMGRRRVQVSRELVSEMMLGGGLRPWRLAEEVPADIMLVGARMREMPFAGGEVLELTFASSEWPYRNPTPLWNPTVQIGKLPEPPEEKSRIEVIHE